MRSPFSGLRAPFASPPLPNLHISGFGVILKKGQLGKCRLIVYLSSPSGYSVNDGIKPKEFSLHYIKVDQIILMVSKYGSGALMAKFDVEAAYHNIAVHPDDRSLLGMKWRGKYTLSIWPCLSVSDSHCLSSIPLQTWLNGSSCIGIIFQICSTILMTLSPQGRPILLSVLSIYKLPCPFARN